MYLFRCLVAMIALAFCGAMETAQANQHRLFGGGRIFNGSRQPIRNLWKKIRNRGAQEASPQASPVQQAPEPVAPPKSEKKKHHTLADVE